VRLIIGSLNNPAALVDAEAAWGRFLAAVPDPLHGLPQTFENHPIDYGDDAGRAQTIAEIGPSFEPDERIWIVMGPGFFASTPAEQILTLLHESCHAQLVLGVTKDRAVVTQLLSRAEQQRRERDRDPFAISQYHLALMFRFFVEEVLAEKLLAEAYPAFAEQRVQMYRRMREGFQGVGDMAPEFRCIGLLYEIARNDLGASISTRPDDRAAFERMALDLEEQLNRCPDGHELLAYRAGLLHTAPPPLPALLAGDELWNRIMRIRR